MRKYIPNILTFLRAFLTVVIIVSFFLDLPNKFVWIFILFLTATFTDFLDGFLARKWRVESTFGNVFDSLFDKILTLSMYMLLIPYNIIHSGIFVALLFREIFVDGLKNYFLSKNKPVPPKITGKLKFVFQIILIGSMLATLIYPNNIVLDYLVILSAVAALFFAYFSAISYTMDYFRYAK